MAKAEIEAALRRALAQIAPEQADTPIPLERPKQAGHGDFSSNVALQLAKSLHAAAASTFLASSRAWSSSSTSSANGGIWSSRSIIVVTGPRRLSVCS